MLCALPQKPSSETAKDTRRVQMKLREIGYDPGPINGVAGPRTQNAIRDYQYDNHLRVDGKVSTRLLKHLDGDVYLSRSQSLGFESSQALETPDPKTVRTVQRALALLQYHPGPIDGVSGPRTQAAIQSYQRDFDLPQDAVISSSLLDHLRQQLVSQSVAQF